MFPPTTDLKVVMVLQVNGGEKTRSNRICRCLLKYFSVSPHPSRYTVHNGQVTVSML